MARQADDSFVCFGAKPDKGFWTWDFGGTGSGNGTREESWLDKGARGAIGDGTRTDAVDTGAERRIGSGHGSREANRHGHRSREANRQEIGSSDSEEDRVKMSRHSSFFVEFSLESTLALVCTCTRCYITLPSALELTPSILFVCSLSSHSLDCTDVAVRKCALPLSEPLVDHRPRSGMVRRSWRIIRGGRGCNVIQFVWVFFLFIMDIFICSFHGSSNGATIQ